MVSVDNHQLLWFYMKSILLKLSGELFKGPEQATAACIDTQFVQHLIAQIKQLKNMHQINIVIGGGNFFRWSKEGKQLGLSQPTADAIGMLATAMNGLLLRDFLHHEGIPCLLMGAQSIPGVINIFDQEKVDVARKTGNVIIFTGGTGNPYFSTDTAAIIRALQVGATTVWKATTVNHVYDADPAQNKNAQALKKISYSQALEKKLHVMDLTALTLAQEHNITLRIFSIFEKNALLQVAQNQDFGSTIC